MCLWKLMLFGLVCAAAVCVTGCKKDEDHDDEASSQSNDDGGGGGHGGGGGSGSGGSGGSGGTGSTNLRDDGAAWQYSDSATFPGKTFDAGCDVRNDGSSAVGSFWVHFYVSTNSLISTADTLVGAVYVSSISASSYANVDFSTQFPLIPEGVYYLGWIIDATESVAESDESDNVVLFSGGTLTVVDTEPNDSAGAAWFLGSIMGTYSVIEKIGWLSDEDWFAFGQDAGLDFSIILTSLPGDYDVQVYEDDGVTLLATSAMGGTSNESIVMTAPYSGIYYIRIYGWGGAYDASDAYELDLDLE